MGEDTPIAIIDYGVGNLQNMYEAFETVAGPLKIPVDIVDAPTDLTHWQALLYCLGKAHLATA